MNPLPFLWALFVSSGVFEGCCLFVDFSSPICTFWSFCSISRCFWADPGIDDLVHPAISCQIRGGTSWYRLRAIWRIEASSWATVCLRYFLCRRTWRKRILEKNAREEEKSLSMKALAVNSLKSPLHRTYISDLFQCLSSGFSNFSKDVAFSVIDLLQFVLIAASVSISRCFLRWSLNRWCGAPLALLPDTSCEKRICLRRRVPGIRARCPAYGIRWRAMMFSRFSSFLRWGETFLFVIPPTYNLETRGFQPSHSLPPSPRWRKKRILKTAWEEEKSLSTKTCIMNYSVTRI